MMMQKFKFFEGVIKDTYIVDIQQGIRTLRATWALELEEEINAYHAIDAGAELSRLISEEIDRDIVIRLSDMINADNENDEILSEITRRINGGQRA
jgi:hypothetical protein